MDSFDETTELFAAIGRPNAVERPAAIEVAEDSPIFETCPERHTPPPAGDLLTDDEDDEDDEDSFHSVAEEVARPQPTEAPADSAASSSMEVAMPADPLADLRQCIFDRHIKVEPESPMKIPEVRPAPVAPVDPPSRNTRAAARQRAKEEETVQAAAIRTPPSPPAAPQKKRMTARMSAGPRPPKPVPRSVLKRSRKGRLQKPRLPDGVQIVCDQDGEPIEIRQSATRTCYSTAGEADLLNAVAGELHLPAPKAPQQTERVLALVRPTHSATKKGRREKPAPSEVDEQPKGGGRRKRKREDSAPISTPTKTIVKQEPPSPSPPTTRRRLGLGKPTAKR
ncbi:hypothetical protein M3Y99_01178100 [Aphelenchoides fujianensis]|nr:hypothetical protein M3Y99_01178100 [Aphelenchoides fujianensis]